MNEYLDLIQIGRKNLYERTLANTDKELNFIPPGFNNNIIWNMGHMIQVSEHMLYRNFPSIRPRHAFDLGLFAKGTRPERQFTTDEILEVRISLIETVALYSSRLESIAAANSMDTLAQLDITPEDYRTLAFHELIHQRAIDRLLGSIP